MYFEERSKHQLRQCASVVCVGKYYTGQLAAADPVCFRVIPRAESAGQGERRNKKVINGSSLTIIITWNVLCVWVDWVVRD